MYTQPQEASLKRTFAFFVSIATLAGVGSAFAMSDGHYDYKRMHCSGAADTGSAAEPGCYTVISTVSDGTGHEYFGAGIRQTKEGEFANTADIWIDLGTGTKSVWTLNKDGISGPAAELGSLADPTTGLFAYFGGDDNLDVGEHDSSEQLNNGPSDGGGIEVNIDPATAPGWLASLQALDVSALLRSPLPVMSGGTGACADGICFSVTSREEVAFAGAQSFVKNVADYSGKAWDPAGCTGNNDDAAHCGGITLKQWADKDGIRVVQPGIQVYEDPDPTASPIGPYPVPALYIGSCGFILGGGKVSFPASAITNSAGQISVSSAC